MNLAKQAGFTKHNSENKRKEKGIEVGQYRRLECAYKIAERLLRLYKIIPKNLVFNCNSKQYYGRSF